jgi:hypothetical protein
MNFSRQSRPIDPVAIAAVLLYVGLVDAAVETFRSAPPVRWWVIAAVATYFLGTACLWRRTAWKAKAIASLLAFTAILAATAWRPGGVSEGVRALGLPTSTLLCLTAAGGVSLAGCVLWRVPAMPSLARWVVAALVVYAVAAFAVGIATGTPFSALLRGESVWRALPLVLQGAVVGGFAMLPLALVASGVTAGLRPTPVGSRARALQQACALATVLAMVLAGVGPQGSTAAPSDLRRATGNSELSPAARIAALENSLRAIEDGARDVPRDRWDPDYVVAQIGSDPQALFKWVRDNTYWVPYHGVLRGPVGVLMDRHGNSLDRALLLGTLLQRGGRSVRLAHGSLTHQQAADLLDPLTSAHPPAAPIADGAASRSDVDTAGRELSDVQVAAMGRLLAALRTRVNDQTERVLRAIAGHTASVPRALERESTIAALRDHWWVQHQEDDGAWVALDPIGTRLTSFIAVGETKELADIGALTHQMMVRVIAEQWSDGGLKEHQILEHVLHPQEVIGKSLVLQFLPVGWPMQPPSADGPQQTLKDLALEQREWAAVLLLDGEVVANGQVSDTGATTVPAADPMIALAARAATSFTGVTPQAVAPNAFLSATWIEYVVHTPGEQERVFRRQVFDLLDASTRRAKPVPIQITPEARLTRSLSLTMRTEILPAVCAIAPEYVVARLAQTMTANRAIFQSLVSSDLTDAGAATALGQQGNSLPGLYAFALARTEWSRYKDHTYLDHISIFTRHSYLKATTGAILRRDAIDIVSNDVAVDLHIENPLPVRVEQGILDTHAESLLSWDGHSFGNTSEAFAWLNDWITLSRSSEVDRATQHVPAGTRARLADELNSGMVLIVPSTPVPANTEGFVGWWRVDPTTGTTLGFAQNGWGQGAEYAETLYVRFAPGFVFEYVLCTTVEEGLAHLANPNAAWGSGAAAAFKGCVLSAIAAGFVATLPIVVMSIPRLWSKLPIALSEGLFGLLRALRRERAIVERGTTVLGHFRVPPGQINYVGTADIVGSHYFSIPSDVWNKMTAAEQRAANVRFLDEAIARGDKFLLSTPASQAGVGSAFEWEVQYLLSRGYTMYGEMSLIPPGL